MACIGEDHFVPLKKECPYKNNCKSSPFKCKDCKNDPDNEDHYFPKPWTTDPIPTIPWPDTNPWSVTYYCGTNERH